MTITITKEGATTTATLTQVGDKKQIILTENNPYLTGSSDSSNLISYYTAGIANRVLEKNDIQLSEDWAEISPLGFYSLNVKSTSSNNTGANRTMTITITKEGATTTATLTPVSYTHLTLPTILLV